MSTWVAFLRGVNLGRRTVKSAELTACLEALGFTNVKTILASGNVRFTADRDEGLATPIAEALAAHFGFAIGVVLRSREELETMVASEPFAAVDAKADVALHVILADRPIEPGPDLAGLPAHIEVVRSEPREIYLVAHRLANGRYTEGLDKLDRMMPKGTLATMRNWNTIRKVLA
ncbi:MAG TPA: DUF1697 domain-containing protein [Alphaproteobacteria bacterium]|nr:DUF1697 domain-containing protein [Alphaproteobacteria bacterium]